MYGSTDSKSERSSKLNDCSKTYNNFNIFFVHDKIGFFLIWSQSTVANGVSRGMSVAVGVSERWEVTCDM